VRIENLRSEKNGNRAKVAATVIWEDCNRPATDLYFETDRAFEEDLTCNPHAFLTGCIVPAMHYGEKRIFIDAEICPELRNGLITAMTWLRHWFYEPGYKLVRIEARVRSTFSTQRTPERAGFFFSGGIDSFATLRSNRISFPQEHPWSIKDGLLVFGLEQDDAELFMHVFDMLSNVAQEADLTLIPVYTNVYLNYRQEDAANKFRFWNYEFQAAALSAIAHIFSRRLTVVAIPASDAIPNDALLNRKHVLPYGSHPVLDPNYSSIDMRIKHDGIILSRFEKTKLVADWDIALQNLRVCNKYKSYKPGALNCGKCEKCFRTMLGLKVLGVLDRTRAFSGSDVHETLCLQKHLNPYYYLELLPLLRERGFDDLAKSIEKKIAKYRRQKLICHWKDKIKALSFLSLSGLTG
jgi:hypothetical protein